MTLETTTDETSFFNGSLTAPGLPVFRRTVTGHHEDGLGHFLVSDFGDHRIVRKAAGFPYEAAQAVMYGTFEMPVNINGVDDLDAIHERYKVSRTDGGLKTAWNPKIMVPLLTSFVGWPPLDQRNIRLHARLQPWFRNPIPSRRVD